MECMTRSCGSIRRFGRSREIAATVDWGIPIDDQSSKNYTMNQYLHQGKTVRAMRLDDGFAELCFDRSGEAINKLDKLTLAEILEAVAAIAAAPDLRGVLVTSAKEVFIVGADITEFGALFKRPDEDKIADFMQAHNLFSPPPYAVDSFILYESRSTKNGVVYDPLRSYKVG